MKKKLFILLSNPMLSATMLMIAIGGVASAALPPAPTLVSSAETLDAKVFCPVVDIMFWVLLSVSIIMVLWAAYLYVTSEGDNEKPSQARKMVLYAAIGIAIALLAKGVPAIIGDLFGVGSSGFKLAC
jgi:4-amino-4-deoxy-L-arabinose transferase-like glycosyltransferase